MSNSENSSTVETGLYLQIKLPKRKKDDECECPFQIQVALLIDLIFLFPATRSVEGQLLNSPSSVRPSVRSPQITEKVFVSLSFSKAGGLTSTSSCIFIEIPGSATD